VVAHTAQLGRRMDGLTNLLDALRDYANAPQNTHKNSSQPVYHTHAGALNDSGENTTNLENLEQNSV